MTVVVDEEKDAKTVLLRRNSNWNAMRIIREYCGSFECEWSLLSANLLGTFKLSTLVEKIYLLLSSHPLVQ